MKVKSNSVIMTVTEKETRVHKKIMKTQSGMQLYLKILGETVHSSWDISSSEEVTAWPSLKQYAWVCELVGSSEVFAVE